MKTKEYQVTGYLPNNESENFVIIAKNASDAIDYCLEHYPKLAICRVKIKKETK